MPEQQNPGPGERRAYRLGRRQQAIDATRDRITAAAFELHASIGPSRTTIRAIADRAGVQRHTVYAHFPEIDDLYRACTEFGMSTTQMPDPGAWAAVGDPAVRLRRGLAALYGWYRANRAMLATILHDIDPTAPPPAEPDRYEARLAAISASLATGWPLRASAATLLTASIELAIGFDTWRSLAESGLSDEEAVRLMAGLVEAVAAGSIAAR